MIEKKHYCFTHPGTVWVLTLRPKIVDSLQLLVNSIVALCPKCQAHILDSKLNQFSELYRMNWVALVSSMLWMCRHAHWLSVKLHGFVYQDLFEEWPTLISPHMDTSDHRNWTESHGLVCSKFSQHQILQCDRLVHKVVSLLQIINENCWHVRYLAISMPSYCHIELDDTCPVKDSQRYYSTRLHQWKQHQNIDGTFWFRAESCGISIRKLKYFYLFHPMMCSL